MSGRVKVSKAQGYRSRWHVSGQVDEHCKAEHVNRQGRKHQQGERIENMSLESTEEGHCSKIVIEGLAYLKLTPVVIQSRNAAKMNEWQPAGLGRQGKC
jgi:hypothetical protein